MRYFNFRLFVICCFLSLLCIKNTEAQYRVYPVNSNDTSSNAPGEGFFYLLPKNYFVVEVTLNKITKYPGPFAEYAEKMLGLSGAIKEKSIQYSIKDIKIELLAKPDKNKTFFVEYPSKSNKVLPQIMPYNSENSWQLTFSNPTEHTLAQFEMYDNYTLIEKIDTVYEEKIIDSVKVVIPKINKKMVEKTTEQKAGETFKKIQDVREAVWLLLSGDYTTDYTNLEYMISELSKEEQNYLSLYSGFTTTEDVNYTFTINLPDEKQDNFVVPLFVFSSNSGISHTFKKNSEQYRLKFVNQHLTDVMQSFLSNNKKKKSDKVNSFYYRIPEYYQVSVISSNNEIKNLGSMPISQYGIINVSPKNTVSLKFNTMTGEIESLNLKNQ